MSKPESTFTFAFSALALALLGACASALPTPCAPVGANFVPHTEPATCWFETSDKPNVDCGLLHLAEVAGDPQACQLSIAWARLTPPHRNATAEPLFLLGGGPGDSLLSRMDDVLPAMGKAAPGRVVIAHDARGTGHSSPALGCTDRAIFEAGPIGTLTEWVARCSAFHRERGHDLDQYRSRVLANDVVALADALHVRTFSVLGVSFGSKLAQTIVRTYPERIRAVVLDAAVPVEARLFEVPAQAARSSLDELFAACARNDACTAQHGDLAAAFEHTSDRLREAPAKLTIHGKPLDYGAPAFVQSVLLLLTDRALIPAAPAFIRELERGEFASAELLLASAGVSTTAWTMNSAVLCADEEPFNERTRAAADLMSFSDYAVVSNYDALHARCVAISVAPEPASIKAPLVTDVPVLAMTGRFDPLSRSSFWDRFSERFVHGVQLEFPDSGHGVWRHPCGQGVIAAFLDEPSAWRAPACYADLQQPVFVSASLPLIRAHRGKARPQAGN